MQEILYHAVLAVDRVLDLCLLQEEEVVVPQLGRPDCL